MMPPNPRVWVWSTSIGSHHVVVAAHTKREAAHAMGMSLHAFNQNASVTANTDDIGVAMANIGVAMRCPIDSRRTDDYEPITTTYVPIPRGKRT